jgi:hypothetical protein
MLAYIVASIVCLLASLIGGGITLVISATIAGVHSEITAAASHENPVGGHTYNWVQCIGAFTRAVSGSSACLWCLTWFNKEPSLIFFVTIGILGLGASLYGNVRPAAQAFGTILGQIVFFMWIW